MAAFASWKNPKDSDPLSLESRIGVPPTPSKSMGAVLEGGKGGEAEAEADGKAAVAAKARPLPALA